MLTVWKYQVVGDGEIQVPKGGRVLHVAEQHGRPTVWMLVDPRASKDVWHLAVLATGEWGVNSDWTYLGTARCGAYVWHVFLRYVTVVDYGGEQS